MSQTDIVLARRGPMPAEPPEPRYIHTRWPSDASLVANGAVVVMALLGAGTLAAGFTGVLQIESPVTAVLIVLMYALAWVAIRGRRNAESHAVTVEDPS